MGLLKGHKIGKWSLHLPFLVMGKFSWGPWLYYCLSNNFQLTIYLSNSFLLFPSLLFRRFALLVSDATSARSILAFKHDEDKIMELDSSKLIVGNGAACDTANFTEYIQKNLKLYELNNDNALTTHATAHFIRKELATALRKGPFQTNILLAGYDEGVGASLYWMDYMGALSKVNFGAHGYAGNFISSVFDRDYVAGSDLAGCMDVVKRCVHELRTRFLISQPKFIVKIVDKDGTRVIPFDEE
jgi:20S proteasome subunit beta 4